MKLFLFEYFFVNEGVNGDTPAAAASAIVAGLVPRCCTRRVGYARSREPGRTLKNIIIITKTDAHSRTHSNHKK